MQQRTARHAGAHRLRPRPRLHGHVRVLRRRATTTESIATIHRALDLGVDLPRHRRHVRPVHQRGARRPGDRRPPRPGRARHQVRQRARRPTADVARHQRPARVRARRPATRSLQRLGVDHIDLYYQHRVDPRRADRGDRRRDGRARAAPARSATSGSREAAPDDDPPRARRAPDHRAADRVLAVDAATSRTRSCRRCRELGIGFVAYSPLGRGFLTGRDPRRSTTSPRTTSAAPRRASRARTSSGTSTLVAAVAASSPREKGVHAGAARARLGAARRATTSCRSPAPSARRTSRRTSRAADDRAVRRRPAARSTRRCRRRGGRRALPGHVERQPLSSEQKRATSTLPPAVITPTRRPSRVGAPGEQRGERGRAARLDHDLAGARTAKRIASTISASVDGHDLVDAARG